MTQRHSLEVQTWPIIGEMSKQSVQPLVELYVPSSREDKALKQNHNPMATGAYIAILWRNKRLKTHANNYIGLLPCIANIHYTIQQYKIFKKMHFA